MEDIQTKSFHTNNINKFKKLTLMLHFINLSTHPACRWALVFFCLCFSAFRAAA